MEVQEVKQQIKDKHTLHFYIFTGIEHKVMDIYINKIAEVNKLKVKRVDSLKDIYSNFNNNAFIKKDYCYVLRDDEDILSNKKLWEDLTTKQVQKNNIIILIWSKVDARTSFYNRFKDDIVMFEPLKDDVLVKYVQKEINLTQANSRHLIAICESDYSRILLEIDKVKQYSESVGTEVNKAFEDLVYSGVIYIPAKDAIFDFTDAFMRRQVKQYYALLNECYRAGESNLTILAVLYTNVKQVLQVQSCQSNDICKSTGLTAWQVKHAKAKSGYYAISDLVYILRCIRDIEKKIKIGEIEETIAVDYLLSKVGDIYV